MLMPLPKNAAVRWWRSWSRLPPGRGIQSSVGDVRNPATAQRSLRVGVCDRPPDRETATVRAEAADVEAVPYRQRCFGLG